jgi:hypothetical protein
MTTRLKDRKELEEIASKNITPHDFIESLDSYFRNICKDALINRKEMISTYNE